MTQNKFTEKQMQLIKKCKNAGYGWAMFASNVEAQGFCTPKQQAMLGSMCWRIDVANIRKKSKRVSIYDHDTDISDCEAMSMGEYF